MPHDPEQSLTNYIHHLERVQQRLVGVTQGEHYDKLCQMHKGNYFFFKLHKFGARWKHGVRSTLGGFTGLRIGVLSLTGLYSLHFVPSHYKTCI